MCLQYAATKVYQVPALVQTSGRTKLRDAALAAANIILELSIPLTFYLLSFGGSRKLGSRFLAKL